MKIIAEYFLASMVIGFLLLYIFYPNPRVIVKYPSVEEMKSDIYVDDEGVCYRYHRREVPDPNSKFGEDSNPNNI